MRREEERRLAPQSGLRGRRRGGCRHLVRRRRSLLVCGADQPQRLEAHQPREQRELVPWR